MRRLAVAFLSLSLLSPPLAAEMQPPAKEIPRIGYLSLRSGPSSLEDAFRQGLRELGYIEGRNVSIEYRWGDWEPDRASTLAAELVRLKVDIIVATGGGP